jgi:hypothetical protein
MIRALLLLPLALAFGGCAAISGAFLFTGMTISCGPMPMSPDQCGGGWLTALFKPDNPRQELVPAPAVKPPPTCWCAVVDDSDVWRSPCDEPCRDERSPGWLPGREHRLRK